jgi:hypothetical protein
MEITMWQSKKVILIIILLLFFNCSSANKNITSPEVSKTEDAQATEILKIIQEINQSSPATISSSFTAIGDSNGKKFNIEGVVFFQKDESYYLSFSDFIFKSKIVDIYRDMNRLFFYYPAEKNLLLDDVNKIDIHNYTGFRAEFSFNQDMFSGKIPLLADYSVNKVLQESGETYYLILENDQYFENIYIKKNIPEKILIIHKKTKEKTEIYLSSVMEKDKSIFYKKVKIIAPSINLFIDIKFTNTKINEPIQIPRAEIQKFKKNIEIIKIN